MREIRTHGSTGREPETDSRRRLNGHEAGNGGHCQVRAYGAPRRLPTLPSPCSTAPDFFIGHGSRPQSCGLRWRKYYVCVRRHNR